MAESGDVVPLRPRPRRLEVEDTYKLVPYALAGVFSAATVPAWVCRGVNGCGCLVLDPASHRLFHDLATHFVVREEKRLLDIERAVERLKTSMRLPRRR